MQASLAMMPIGFDTERETVQGANGGPIVLMSAGMPFRSTIDRVATLVIG